MANLQIRIDDDLRRGAADAFASMGLSLADGVRSYLNYVKVKKELPFAPVEDPWYAHNASSHIPNTELQKTIDDAERGIGTENFTNLDEMFRSLGIKC